ncbi:MAG: ATP-binding cassette domain-containing protein, partial [Chlamydiota bacterium]
MTLFLNCQSLSKSFGTRRLFKGLSFSIFSKDRVGLIGPNGSGKSTLLKILSGEERADEGEVAARRGLKVGYVPQSCDFAEERPEAVLLNTLSGDERPIYEKELLVQKWLSKLGFTGSEPTANLLSGGWKKRLSLAQALIVEPDLVLLDEPTNHLDLEGILFLEKFLMREVPSFLMVSHDRYFLKNMINRTIEVNPVYPDGLFCIDGSYSHFLELKEQFLSGQLEQERSVASKARREL